MNAISTLDNQLYSLAGEDSYLYAPEDMRALFGSLSDGAYRSLLKRAEENGVLLPVCRGLYLHAKSRHHKGDLLFHAAARLRASSFNYISLETALSDAGIISQIPLQWITIMSSGRSSTIRCDPFGTIEFVHTKKAAGDLAVVLVYDRRCRLWRAKPELALHDMRRTGRNLDLIDWEAYHESVREPYL